MADPSPLRASLLKSRSPTKIQANASDGPVPAHGAVEAVDSGGGAVSRY